LGGGLCRGEREGIEEGRGGLWKREREGIEEGRGGLWKSYPLVKLYNRVVRQGDTRDPWSLI